jgi:hypothetical protein
MVVKGVMGKVAVCIAICVSAIANCCFSGDAIAAMTLDQMKSLKGASRLEITVDQLFQDCGLAAAIVDHGLANGTKLPINWRGTTMRLSAMDWDAVYGKRRSEPGTAWGWVNRSKIDTRCTSGLSQLLLHTKGQVGVLTVTKKTQGLGYITKYDIPKDLYKAHKVVGVEATLARSLPVPTLVGRYGQPDEVLKQPGIRDRFRYWIVTLHGHRPESLYAVDFEVDDNICKTYSISTSDADFVQQRLESLLRQWEKDYVLD